MPDTLDRHGQSHADDQRHRRARLGRGRPRGRERLLRHAGDDPRAGHRRRAPDGPSAAGRARHRSGAHGHRAPSAHRSRGSLRRILWRRRLDAVCRRSRRHRQHDPGIRRQFRLLPHRRPDAAVSCARRVAAPITSVSWRNTQSGRASGSIPRRLRASRTRSRSISTGSRSASQVRAGRRTASPPAERSRRLRRLLGAPPCRVICRAARQRRSGDRCDHELHQHVRSETSGRRRSARPQGTPLRPHPARLGEDVAGARLADRRTLPAPRRPAGGPRGRGLRHRRLRLHDLHRQFRPAARDHRAGHGGARHLPVAVLSGNRNFPGRVHPQLEAGFLASPPLVVAFALAGDVNRDILTDPIGRSPSGEDIRLADLWPTGDEIDAALALAIDAGDYETSYEEAEASEAWRVLDAPATALFPWNESSTYIRRPPFAGFGKGTLLGTYAAHPLLVLGDDITTDHISPAGLIPPQRGRRIPGGARREPPRPERLRLPPRQLGGHGPGPVHQQVGAQPARPADRAGLHRFMSARASICRCGAQPSATRDEGASVVVVAGERYGMGSSRDWAAKGVGAARRTRGAGLELRAHPSLQPDRHGHPAAASSAGAASERSAPASRRSDPHRCRSRKDRSARARCRSRSGVASGASETFMAIAAIETGLEVEILRGGGIIPLILHRVINAEGTSRETPAPDFTGNGGIFGERFRRTSSAERQRPLRVHHLTQPKGGTREPLHQDNPRRRRCGSDTCRVVCLRAAGTQDHGPGRARRRLGLGRPLDSAGADADRARQERSGHQRDRRRRYRRPGTVRQQRRRAIRTSSWSTASP